MREDLILIQRCFYKSILACFNDLHKSEGNLSLFFIRSTYAEFVGYKMNL
jgi:hypothetical protein